MIQKCVWISFVLYNFLISGCYGADILAIIPTASFSHQIPFRPLWRELAKRGHNITLVTTDPMNDPNLKNVKEIDISYGYEYKEKYKVADIISNKSKSSYESVIAIQNAENDTNNEFFRSPEGQNLIHNRDNHFDLLIVEAQLPTMMIFSWRYQIPFIAVSSLDCGPEFHEAAGNLVHPAINPDLHNPSKNISNTTFRERLKSFSLTNIYKSLTYLITFPKERKFLQYYFGDNVPPLREILNNMSMLFVTTNPVFHPVRPLMPNTITIGNGLHFSKAQPLSQDIQQFLDDAKEGAIYFSLGSNIKARYLKESTKVEFLKALSGLPYRVLWKFNETFDNLPEHILVKKWFNGQLDILSHPNIKVFITQGGLQSMQESIYANKPMIGIPYFGDQHGNINRMVQLGYGLKVHKDNITEASVREAVFEIMSNPKYTKKAQEYGAIFRDVDTTSLDKAVWWTEYVIRHKGARHFRNPLLDMPFWKVYLLDVFGIIVFVFVSIIISVRLILKTLKLACTKGNKKVAGMKKKLN